MSRAPCMKPMNGTFSSKFLDVETNNIYRGPSNVLDTLALDAGCRMQDARRQKRQTSASKHAFLFLSAESSFLSLFLLTYTLENACSSRRWLRICDMG